MVIAGTEIDRIRAGHKMASKPSYQWKAVKGVYYWVWEDYPLRLKAHKIKYPKFLPNLSSKVT